MGLSWIPLIPAPFKIVARSTQRRVKVRAIGAAARGSRPGEGLKIEICQPTYLILLGGFTVSEAQRHLVPIAQGHTIYQSDTGSVSHSGAFT